MDLLAALRPADAPAAFTAQALLSADRYYAIATNPSGAQFRRSLTRTDLLPIVSALITLDRPTRLMTRTEIRTAIGGNDDLSRTIGLPASNGQHLILTPHN
ncbi:hypothetical protein [Streptacidiphilus sp. EB103A]|uniref:hypothetical protein n=1 Tax=Streptacidiphilus sp. EB103A TaxID=3156275 RepID=UPI003513C1BF